MRIAPARSMKAMDTYAIETMGISSTWLMRNAAGCVAEEIHRTANGRKQTCAVFCGTGNNGGDGAACARLLSEKGHPVRVFLCGERNRLSPDMAEMVQELEETGIYPEPFPTEEAKAYVQTCDIIVDALFGTGLNKPIRGVAAEAVACINGTSAAVYSCDIASGIHADTGEVMGCAVRADCTVTFTMPKPGQLLPPGEDYTGRLMVCPIGIPEEAQVSQFTIGSWTEEPDVLPLFPKRRRSAHKGDFGKLLMICGSVGMTGAPVLAAKAALRSGAGLVTLCVPEPVWPIVAEKTEEPLVYPAEADAEGRFSIRAWKTIREKMQRADAILLGPGLGRSNELDRLVRAVLAEATCPVVLDADGLNAVASNPDWLKTCACPLVMTPHDGEFARFGIPLEGHDRFAAAKELAERTGTVVLLKGHRTIVTDGEHFHVNSTGNPGMAVGGSGDMLAGIITALIGQGCNPYDAAWAGAWLHGRAADFCTREGSEYATLPHDWIEAMKFILP